MSNVIRGALAAFALVAAAPASATVFSFEETDPSGATAAGKFTSVSGSYGDQSNLLTWNTTFKKRNGKLPDAFWMVITDGPNAKGNDNTYAVLYGSIDGGDSGTLSAHVYDGQNGPNSWANRDFVAAFDDAITVTNQGSTRNLSFAIDATEINAFGASNGLANWFGTGFGEKVGIWQHAFTGDVDFRKDGSVEKLKAYRQSWFDTGAPIMTTLTGVVVVAEVPEPTPLALVGLGMAVAGFAARRRKA